jgi:hypothetical protein
MAEYDYTKDDVPFNVPGEDVDNFMLPDVAAPQQTAEEIEKSNGFRDIPPGDHILVVQGFRGGPEPVQHTVQVNGQIASYNTYSIKVKFSLPTDPRATVEDYFVLPPADQGELTAYYRGVPTDKTNQTPGMAANKFYHFIGKLGFPYPPGGKLPEAARKLGNWKGRAIAATIVDGGNYTDKDGNHKKAFNKIKFWSYRQANHENNGPGSIPGSIPGSTPAVHAGRQSVAAATAAAGLDNV